MDELREKIKEVIYEEFGLLIADDSHYDAVPGIIEGILAIPEIAKALACLAAFEDVKTQGRIIKHVQGALGHSIKVQPD